MVLPGAPSRAVHGGPGGGGTTRLLLLPLAVTTVAVAATVPRPNVDRFDEHAAWARLVAQVELGPEAGWPAARKFAAG